jgi:hypothetical protein
MRNQELRRNRTGNNENRLAATRQLEADRPAPYSEARVSCRSAAVLEPATRIESDIESARDRSRPT